MTSLQFDLPKDQSSIIKVFGVGGGGSNAVNHMYQQGIIGVNFVICNTDAQALDISPIPNKIQLGPLLTQGLGAGSNPEIGMQATEESVEEIRQLLSKNTKMVFVTAGMGGGTGTGGAPVVAKIAKEMGILTVGIVTTPFSFEGKRKFNQAIEGIEKLKAHVDTILVISNDKIREMHGNARQSEAFNFANNILTMAAKSISEIITVPGYINVDFADVRYVMSNSGAAIMGAASAEGEGRALKAIQGAMNSPLLNDNDIRGAKRILLNISSGTEQVTIDEITEINQYIQDVAKDTDIIFGTCDDLTLDAKLSVTLIATGFEGTAKPTFTQTTNRIVHELHEKPKVQEVVEAVKSPVVEEKVEEVKQELEEEMMVHNAPVQHEELTEEIVNLFEEEETTHNLFSFNTETSETVSFEFEVNHETALPQVDEELHEEETFTTVQKNDVEEDYVVTNVKKYELPETPIFAAEKELTDRKRILNQYNFRTMNRQNMSELESTPAYLRKGIEINNNLPSEESHASRFTISEDMVNQRPEIKKNNSFLHDNVD